MLIKDLVKLQTNAEFFSDVQLRWFWEPEKNAKLAQGYIFTRQASDSRKSTVDALDAVRFGLTDPGSENRMLFLATFGQGKTHLALAMANFFAKTPESPEVQDLIKSLKFAYNGSAAINNFTDLKERNPKHLVVCLQGDEGGFDLASYFVREVERSLSADLSASAGMLPLWFKTALETIDKSVVPHKDKADAFLAAREMDLPQLRQRLKENDASLYDLVCDLIQHVTGVPPNLGPRLALHNLVSYVCSEYCGAGKPYAGLIVLFDEFNAFMHAYSKRDTAGTPLQDLLNGIANNRETSVFVGFAQRDPMTIVNALTPTNRDALTVEMSRIPQDRRMHLFNNLETVLDAYIGADEATLRSELESAGAWPALEEAEEAALMLFSRRYDRELRWNLETFRKNVTIGCFPLHPLTTALLCSVDLAETGSNARGLLQFVLKSQESIEEQPVAVDGVPTWICATRMVDWFEKTLCSEEIHWEQYQHAVFAGGGDLSDLQKNVLKAMLLHLIAKLPTASVHYERAIALLAGVKENDARTALREMATRNLVERDPINNKYAFFSASGGDRDLREYINRGVENTALKIQTLQEPATISIAGFRSTEVQVDWGNAVDWQANPTLLTSEFFTELHVKGLLAKNRAPVVWLIPRDENDRSQLEAKAQSIVDAACGAIPQPLVVFLPNAPYPGVLEGLRKLQVVEDLPTQRRIEYAAFLQQAKTRINDQIKEQTLALRSGSKRWFAHGSLKAGLEADNVTVEQAVIRRVVTDCFKTAPPSFIQNQKEESAKLRKATLLLSKLVLVNQVSSLDRMLSEQPNEGNLRMAKDILDSVLTVGRPAAWGVIGGGKHLQEPAHNRVRLAWEQLSNAFPPNGAAGNLKEVLETLQKPPYGYDFNTLTLLVCAWIGFHRHDLEITQRGSAFSVARMQSSLDVGKPADFITDLLGNFYRIKRRDPSIALQEINTTLAQVQQLAAHPLSRQEATDAVIKLDEFTKDESNRDHALRPKAVEALERIQSGLKLASDYDTAAEEILSKLTTVRRVNDALSLLNKAQHLPQLSGVTPTKQSVPEIIQTAEETLDKRVAATCKELSTLKSLTDYSLQEEELRSCHKALREKQHLQSKVLEAITALLEAKTALETKLSEGEILARIEAFSAQVPLLELEATLEKLGKIVGGSEAVTARLNAKRGEVSAQITSLAGFADAIDARIEAVQDGNALRNVERDIDVKGALFSGHTASEEKLQTARARCAQLAEYFSTLTQLTGRGLHKPSDLSALLEETAKTRAKFSAGLSSTQLELLDKLEASKQKDAETKSQEASDWLKRIEKAWQEESMKPAELLQRLDNPPTFLPDASRGEVSVLATKIQDKIESNEEEWIVTRFQGISDKARRERLLKRLQDMLAAE
jgi:hypothetical protein